ncbi:hypothetical protein [Rhodococcoides corynebacterioides]|uniref:hypothetical protein n=1 Tax=Rhodococcoides corynebacterioides TaxID=53972 RepID=UPI003ADD9E57
MNTDYVALTTGAQHLAPRWVFVVTLVTAPVLVLVATAFSASFRDVEFISRAFGPHLLNKQPTGAVVDLTDDVKDARRATRLRNTCLLAVVLALAFMNWWILTGLHPSPFVYIFSLPILLSVVSAIALIIQQRNGGRSYPRGTYALTLLSVFAGLALLAIWTYLTYTIVSVLLLIPLTVGLVGYLVLPVLVVILWPLSRMIPNVLKFGAVPRQLSQRLSTISAQESRAADPRPPVLFLRSFGDDGLVIRTHRTARHGLHEYATAMPFERFEVVLTWALKERGPVSAIGIPGTSGKLQPVGAAREFFSDDTWRNAASDWMRASSLIVCVLGQTGGLAWEMGHLKSRGFLHKTLFVVPPVANQDTANRIAIFCYTLGIDREHVPPVINDGRHVVGIVVQSETNPVLIVSDGRDDHTYQTLIREISSLIPPDTVGQPVRVFGEGSAPFVERLADTLTELVWTRENLLETPTTPLRFSTGIKYAVSSLFGLRRDTVIYRNETRA